VDTILAFAGTAVITLIFQTAHWLVRRRSGETHGWVAWLTSAQAWIVGWPIALVVGSYVCIYLLLQAAST
jgi:hypothetical protein